MKIVRNMNMLKSMQKKGFIELHHQTGRKITGLYSNKEFTCYYVDAGMLFFKYNGKKYTTKYFDGCLFPYIVEV